MVGEDRGLQWQQQRNVLLKRKYDLPYQELVINTDHAQLFLMSCLIQKVGTERRGQRSQVYRTP